MKAPLTLLITALAALSLTACGSEGIEVREEADREGAELFAERCSGCHTLSAAGADGSGNRLLRAQGPNLDQRSETFEEALYAIRNGGFSGAIMPQNIVVGEEAELVAEFVAEYSGGEVEEQPRPSTESSESGGDSAGASGAGAGGGGSGDGASDTGDSGGGGSGGGAG